MAVSKIELVGTENLTSSERILLYNTETFKNEFLIKSLGLPRIEGISLESANNILDSLLASPYYHLLNKPFIYVNDRDDPLFGQGFDTILFLKGDRVLLGYAYLGKQYGKTYSGKGVTHIVDKVKITVSEENNSIKVGDSEVKFDMEISRQKPRVDNVKIGPKVYQGFGNYGVYVRDFLKGNKKDLITDLGYIKYGVYSGRISLNKIDIPSTYSNLNKTQIGFYQGDPSLYMWNDNGEYSILSLTQEVVFNETIKTTKAHTVARPGISKNEVYRLPDLGKGDQKIRYFAGQYCIVEADEILYVLDIPRQSSPEDGPRNKGWLISGKKIIQDSFEYYKASQEGWTKTAPTLDAVYFESLDIATGDTVRVNTWNPIFLNNFVIDQSLRAEICEIGSLGWRNYQESLKSIGSLCNTEVDSKTLVECGCTVIKKVGNWFVFEIPTTNTYLYSNMIQTVEFLKTESPIVVNDEVLLCREGNGYTLFDRPGKYISREYQSRFIKKDGYTVSGKTAVIQSPIDIQKSFFGAFRRNILPTNVSDFKVIGALGGIIFYKTGNTISYL